MRSILSLMLLASLVCSCGNCVSREEIQKKYVDDVISNCKIITIEKNGASHEFLMYDGVPGSTREVSLTHWPSCIYCCDIDLQNPEGNPD